MRNSLMTRTLSVSGEAIPRQADGSAALKLCRISGGETLSQTYSYQLDLLTALDMPDSQAANLDLLSMAGRELTVTIQLDGMSIAIPGIDERTNVGSGTREISGIVTDATLLEKRDRHYLYRLVMEPWIVLAKQRTDYRIFQKKSVVDIIEEVLGSQYLYLYEKRLSQIYPLLDYEVQYGESDYDFIQRLMERSGIYWFFSHSNGTHRMVLTDNMGAHRPVESKAYQTLPYSPFERRQEREFISHFGTTERIQSGMWTSDDFDFTQPTAALAVHNTSPKPIPYNNLTVYEWPGNYTDPAQGADFARVRMEEIRARSWRASGRGNLRDVVCGTTFELKGYPQKVANCEYLVIKSTLEAEEIGEESDAGECRFAAHFDVQPVKLPYRPERLTPRPRTTGPQTAVVTGPPGHEIWTDEYGRVKLKFHWDRSSVMDHNSSCWVRVSYPWAGSNFGGVNIPRIGTEVIVDFENGDPNYPLVTGRLYNAATMPPWELPGNASQSGLISRSLGGMPGNANALRFEDRAGQEELWMQAERDMLSEIKNNEVHKVGANRSKSIGGDEISNIEGTRSETVNNDEKIELMANRSRSVRNDDQLDIGGDQQTKINGKQRYEVQNDYDRIIGGNDSRDVTGDQNIKVGQNQQSEIQQDMSEKISGDRNTDVGKNYRITVSDKFELSVGSSSLVIDSQGNISINGANISIGSSGPVQINGDTVDLN